MDEESDGSCIGKLEKQELGGSRFKRHGFDGRFPEHECWVCMAGLPAGDSGGGPEF